MSQTVSFRPAARDVDPAPYHGSQHELRDFVAECMERTRFYAAMSVDYTIADDDVGLEYSIRCAVASLKQGASVLKMLKQKNAKLLRERQIERAARDGADTALSVCRCSMEARDPFEEMDEALGAAHEAAAVVSHDRYERRPFASAGEKPERKARSGAPILNRDKRREVAPADGGDDGGRDTRPEVFVVPGKLPEAADRVEEILIEADAQIYSRSGILARPVVETVPASNGRTTTVAHLKPLCGVALADHAARVMRFRRHDARSRGWVDMHPPVDLMATVLTREGAWKLPRVAGIITTPTLRPDGTIADQPGYDPATRLYLALDPGFRMPAVLEHPGREEAEEALQLLDDLLSGFPFAGVVDHAVALSGLMTATVRGILPVAPLHAIRARSPGSGKSFYVDIASTIATGRRCPVIAAGKTEEEMEKRLGALLREAVQIISIDNVNGELGGDMLCLLTERPLVRVRTLGKGEAPEIECRSAVFATGNNLVLVGDMTRRTVLCTLDAEMERPELRQFDFDPIKRVEADRGAYVAAVLTIIRAYRAAGSPAVCGPYGSYEDWSATVRSPLVWLGHSDPVASAETAREEDPELSAIRELFSHWRQHLNLSSGYTTNTIIKTACEKSPSFDYGMQDFRAPEFRDLLLRQAGDGGAVNSRRLGKWLSKIKGRVLDGYRIEMKEDGSHGNRFMLRQLRTAEPAGVE